MTERQRSHARSSARTDDLFLRRRVRHRDHPAGVGDQTSRACRRPPEIGNGRGRFSASRRGWREFVLSFVVIGLFWSGHHRVLALVRRFDQRMTIPNMAMLMFIALLPFSTGLVSVRAAVDDPLRLLRRELASRVLGQGMVGGRRPAPALCYGRARRREVWWSSFAGAGRCRWLPARPCCSPGLRRAGTCWRCC